MSREAVATALDEAAEALARAAHALRGTEQPAAGVVPPSAPAPAAPQGSPTPARSDNVHPVDTNRCPKHGVEWEHGQYGPYCKQMTDDPAWGKRKVDRDGNPILWCKLTPKNAPDWVRAHGLPG